MYDPNYYCCDCGKKLGIKSHSTVDSLGDGYYDDRYCRACEEAELAHLQDEDDPSDCPCGCGASCAEQCWHESEWEDKD